MTKRWAVVVLHCIGVFRVSILWGAGCYAMNDWLEDLTNGVGGAL
jgi:hypothetical protein